MIELPDVLATRYASPELVALWAPRAKVILERRLSRSSVLGESPA